RERKEDAIVVGILSSTEGALDPFDLADDLKELSLDVDFLPYWIGGAEQFLGRVGAENDDRSVGFVVDFAEPASRFHAQVENIFDRRQVAFEDSLLWLAVAVFHHVGAGSKLRLEEADAGSHGFYMR